MIKKSIHPVPEDATKVARRAVAAPKKPSAELTLAPELAEAVGFGLRRAVSVADDTFVSHFASLEISTQQYAVLLTVRQNPGCQPSAVSALLKISPNNLVPQIDSLVSRGFIRRSLSTTDRRIRHLRLTPSGERFAEELVKRHDAIRLWGEERMGTENLAELVRLLTLYAQPRD